MLNFQRRVFAAGIRSQDKRRWEMAKLRLLTSVAVMAAMLMAALPATAFADDDKARVECLITLDVINPGADVVKEKKKHYKVKNSGQLTYGSITCMDESGDLVPSLSGTVATDHGSKVKLNKDTGEFKGKLKGDLSLINTDGDVLHGKLKGRITGTGMLIPGFLVPDFPDAQLVPFAETIKGKAEVEGDGIEFKVKFTIILDPSTGALSGAASGKAEFDDEDDD